MEKADRGPPPSRGDFHIAIFCALPIESTAIMAMFDQVWDNALLASLPYDISECSLGRIWKHNVVVAHLPGMGTVSAAASVGSLKTAFSKIELVLVVGICGGVPSKGSEEIILGDVVISHSIVQYDFGHQYPHDFMPKDTIRDNLPRHGPYLQSFLHRMQTLQAKAELLENMHSNVTQMLNRTEFSDWRRPSPAVDRLFDTAYQHRHQIRGVCSSCDTFQDNQNAICEKANTSSCFSLGCSDEYAIPRARLDTAIQQGLDLLPEVHFGTVASGNRIMKSGLHRDDIAMKTNAIAFEMEGSGLWNYGPTLIVKGVCDYADSHKNDVWQLYACATAASCAKALLKTWRSTRPIDHVNHVDSTANPMPTQAQTESVIDTLWFGEIHKRFNGVEHALFESFRWIFYEDKNPLMNDRLSSEARGLGRNIRMTDSALSTYTAKFRLGSIPDWDPCGLKTWLRHGEGIFWITGKPGCGKSTLMKLIYEDAQYRAGLDQWALNHTLLIPSFFSWRAGSTMQKSQQGFLQSLLHQIFKSLPMLVTDVLEPVEWRNISLTSNSSEAFSRSPWDLERVKVVFAKLLQIEKLKMCILIDGLDEMEWRRMEMADYLVEITQTHKVKILLAGRSLPEFSRIFQSCETLVLHKWTQHDAKTYAQGRLLGNQFLRDQVDESPQDFKLLMENLLAKAEGVFIWLKTALTTLIEGIYRTDTLIELVKRLEKLPPELFDLYKQILSSTEEAYADESKRMLSLIMAATSRQKSSLVFSFAMKYDSLVPDWIVTQTSLDDTSFRKLQARARRRLESVCGNFIQFKDLILPEKWRVGLMHRTVYDFLRSPEIQTWISVNNHGSQFYHIANCMGEFAARLTHAEIPNRSRFVLSILDFPGNLVSAHSGPSVKLAALAFQQLEIATFHWFEHDADFPFNIQEESPAMDLQYHNWDHRYFTALVGEYSLVQFWLRNSHRKNVAFFGFTVYGRLTETAQCLASLYQSQFTTEDRIDMMVINCFSSNFSGKTVSAPLIKEFFSQDPNSVYMFWTKLVQIIDLQASMPSGSYRHPEEKFFADRFIDVVATLLRLGVDPDILVSCSLSGTSRVVHRTPLRVFRRCEAYAKTIVIFYILDHELSDAEITLAVDQISSVVHLLLRYGANDIEQQSSDLIGMSEEEKFAEYMRTSRQRSDSKFAHYIAEDQRSDSRETATCKYYDPGQRL